MTRSLLGSLGALLLAAGTAHATPITFFDDDFAPGEWNRHDVRNGGPHTRLPRDLFHGSGSEYGTHDWNVRWEHDYDRRDNDRWRAGGWDDDRGHGRREHTSHHEDNDHERGRRDRNHDDKKHHGKSHDDKDRHDRNDHDRDHRGGNHHDWSNTIGHHPGRYDEDERWRGDRFDWKDHDWHRGHYVKLDREDCDDPMTPVPEPGTLLLLGSSLAGIGVAVKRRRATRSTE